MSRQRRYAYVRPLQQRAHRPADPIVIRLFAELQAVRRVQVPAIAVSARLFERLVWKDLMEYLLTLDCDPLPIDPFERAADCERFLQKSQDPEQRLVLSKLRDLWTTLGNERNLIRERDDELANDIERLARLQSEFMGVSSAKPQ
jgi:hypothetical protein